MRWVIGYYTNYDLETRIVITNKETGKIHITTNSNEFITDEILETYSGYGWDDFRLYGAKWYDWHSNMIDLSLYFKDTLFILTGEGEESGDLWKAYFLGGKSQVENAKIVYDPFDPTKLQ